MSPSLREGLLFAALFGVFLFIYFNNIQPDKDRPPPPSTELDGFARQLQKAVGERDLPAYLDLWHAPADDRDRIKRARGEFVRSYGDILRKVEGIVRALPTADIRFSGENGQEAAYDYDYREFKKTKHGRINLVRVEGRWKLADID